MLLFYIATTTSCNHTTPQHPLRPLLALPAFNRPPRSRRNAAALARPAAPQDTSTPWLEPGLAAVCCTPPPPSCPCIRILYLRGRVDGCGEPRGAGCLIRMITDPSSNPKTTQPLTLPPQKKDSLLLKLLHLLGLPLRLLP
jgi:hypothetical protein